MDCHDFLTWMLRLDYSMFDGVPVATRETIWCLLSDAHERLGINTQEHLK